MPFSQEAFFSIVEDRSNPDMLVVRSRVKGDIEKYWPDATTPETPEADYLYRARIARGEVALVIAKAILKIDYSNFKDAIHDRGAGPGQSHQNELSHIRC